MPHDTHAPLEGPPPPEVRLPRSALARVLAQVRFSPILRIGAAAGVEAFQETIRADYPLLEQLNAQQLQVDVGIGAPAFRSAPLTVWRFSDAKRTVVFSLTQNAATLEALTYEGRDQFLAQWASLLSRLGQEYFPSLATRAAVRYVNRVTAEDWLTRLAEFVAPSFVGLLTPDLGPSVVRTLSEALVDVQEGRAVLRWGSLPATATIDPSLLPPVQQKSWILDIDVSSEEQRPFVAEDLDRLSRNLSQRAYAIFRYAVTQRGLEFFGA